jgi:hypothetical protein
MHRAALALLALCACENDDGTIVSNGVIAEVAASSVGVWGPTSAAPDTLLVRAVDAAWLSTGPGVVSAVVDGVPVEVEVDPRGYGLLPVAAVGEVALGGLGAERAVVGGPAWASGWGPALAGPGVPTALEAARGGSLAAVGEQIWWVGPSLPAHPVVGFAPGSTPRVRGLPVDDDAAIDAVAFAGERVVLLRGREGGGASAGLVLDAAGWEARGADVRDMDGDGSRDLVIAWLTPSGGVLQVWSGDGSWVFEPLYERAIPSDPLDLAVAADRADGLPIATAITADGGWQRLVRTAAGEWRLTGPPLTISGVLGSTVRSGGDYDGSGNDNLVTAQPRVAGQEREAMIWSLDRDPPTFTRTVWAGGHLAYGDLEREGRVHLLGIEEGSRALRYLTWRDGQALNRDLGTVTGFGPIGLGELDGDPIPDLLVADEVWTWFRGLDDGGDDASRWRPERALGPPVGLDLWGPVAASSGGRVVGITRTGDLLRVSRLRFDGLAPVADSHTLIGPVADEVVDLAVCGDVAYVLTLDAVIAVRIGGAELGRRALGAPRAIACGAGPGAGRGPGRHAPRARRSRRRPGDGAVCRSLRDLAGAGRGRARGGRAGRPGPQRRSGRRDAPRRRRAPDGPGRRRRRRAGAGVALGRALRRDRADRRGGACAAGLPPRRALARRRSRRRGVGRGRAGPVVPPRSEPLRPAVRPAVAARTGRTSRLREGERGASSRHRDRG